MSQGVDLIRLVAHRQQVDEQTLEAMATEECRALGLALRTTWVDAPEGLSATLAAARAAGDPTVVLPAPGAPDLVDLVELVDVTDPGGPAGTDASGHGPLVRLDLVGREPDRSPAVDTHVQGRGAWGLVWALRAAHHRRRHPVHRVPYGEHPDQFGELRLPTDPTVRSERGEGPAPVVAVLHGGFWRSCWQLDLMDALSIDLAERGVASWNLEYRRPDRHGWAATVSDVAQGLDHLERMRDRWPIDPDRFAVAGHSAGGSLAAQAVADRIEQHRPAPSLVVQLAGLVDLVTMHERDLGDGAVPRALGGTPQEHPLRYAQASPVERLPSGVAQLVVVGGSDGWDLREMNRRYVRQALAAGDDVELVEGDGDHFSVIDPTAALGARAASEIARRLLS